jgi:hypothetical protein
MNPSFVDLYLFDSYDGSLRVQPATLNYDHSFKKLSQTNFDLFIPTQKQKCCKIINEFWELKFNLKHYETKKTCENLIHKLNTYILDGRAARAASMGIKIPKHTRADIASRLQLYSHILLSVFVSKQEDTISVTEF